MKFYLVFYRYGWDIHRDQLRYLHWSLSSTTMVLFVSVTVQSIILTTLAGVDIELWAHEHEYQRMWPVYNRKVYNGSESEPYVDPKAPVHFITGSAVSHTIQGNTLIQCITYRVAKRDMSSLLIQLCHGMLLGT